MAGTVQQEGSRIIRITTATKRNATRITVDGHLIGEYVETIETVVKQAVKRGGAVRLFLRDVFTIDGSGRALLGRLAAAGIRLSATGVYTSYVVSGLSRSAAHPRAA